VEKSPISAVDRTELKVELIALVKPIVTDHGAELVDVEISGSKGGELIRLLVHAKPAITLAQCEAISREVADSFDVEDPVPGRYRLEVTSPGLDRPLLSDDDFARASGRQLKVVFHDGRVAKGRLASWDASQLLLEGPAASIERANIAKALIEPEL
jgi:ribosome maturation factor RimP